MSIRQKAVIQANPVRNPPGNCKGVILSLILGINQVMTRSLLTLKEITLELSNKQKKYLKGLAHSLNPVVMIGNQGVSEAVVKEIHLTLEAHELIKIKIRCDDQEQLHPLVDAVLAQSKASLVQLIGHSLVLFRPSKETKIKLPV